MVRPYEAGYEEALRPDALLNYLQDAAFMHSVAGGFSAPDLLRKGRTWVLSRYHVQVKRYPAVGERVHVRTWYPGPQKPFYLRDWRVADSSGSVLALATSSWIILDITSMRPTDDGGMLSRLDPVHERALEDPFDPLPELTDPGFVSRFHVRRGDTDLNRHVNHVRYIEWALESVMDGVGDWGYPCEIEAGFRAQARFGDLVLAKGAQEAGNLFRHQLVKEPEGIELTRLVTRWKGAAGKQPDVPLT